MAQERMAYEEVKLKANEIYKANIRDRLAPGDEERYVKIDVISGDYEIGDNSATTGRKLRERRPDAVIHTMQRHRSYVAYLRTPGRRIREEKANL
jgi:hypothetical protein